MGRADPPAEIALLHYPGAQLSALHGLTDVFGIADDRSREIAGPAAPVLRVSHWRPTAAGDGIERFYDTHPGLPGHPSVTIAGPSLRELPTDAAMLDLLGDWLRMRHAGGSVVGSVCSGAFLLGHAGLLAGRVATTHWCHAADLAARFPDTRIEPGRLIVDDGDIITSGAVMAWIDLGLRLVERLLGPEVMVATARYMLFDPSGREQRHYAGFAPPLNHGDAAVLRVQHWLAARSGRDADVATMAAVAGLAPRTFERRFRKATGVGATEYCQHLKVGRARELLQSSGKAVAQVAWEVGYCDEAAFRKVFRRIVGLAPGAYRRRFRPAQPLRTANPPRG